MADTHPHPTEEQSPLVALIHSRGGTITTRQLQQTGHRYRANVELARVALDDLTTAGIGIWHPDNKTFSLNPKAVEGMDLERWTRKRRKPEGEIAKKVTTPEAVVEVPSNNNGSRLPGLGDIPPAWPTLPANATLQVEIGWVQSNRLAVVGESSSGVTVVRLDRAHEPAPSRAALGWLETSIRSYAKYVDIVARSLKDEQDEQEQVRRERLRFDEIDALLAEMHDDQKACPTCGRGGSKPDP